MDEECVESLMYPGAARHRPEPPRVLAKQTRFSTHEIKLMYRGFKQECPSGVVDEDTFKHIFSQFFPLGDASAYAHFVFNTVKHKHSENINFEEFLVALSRVARGSTQDKLSWVFSLYDTDGDGHISRQELAEVVRAVYLLLGRATVPPYRDTDATAHADRVFAQMDLDRDGVVSREELTSWVLNQPHAAAALHALDTSLSDPKASSSTNNNPTEASPQISTPQQTSPPPTTEDVIKLTTATAALSLSNPAAVTRTENVRCREPPPVPARSSATITKEVSRKPRRSVSINKQSTAR